MSYVRKPEFVEAFQVPAASDLTARLQPPHWVTLALLTRKLGVRADGAIYLIDGDVHAAAAVGEWIVMHEDGELSLYGDKQFKVAFEQCAGVSP